MEYAGLFILVPLVIFYVYKGINAMNKKIADDEAEEQRKINHERLKAEKKRRLTDEENERVRAEQLKFEEQERLRKEEERKRQEQEKKRQEHESNLRKKQRASKIRELTNQYDQSFKSLGEAHSEFIMAGFSCRIFEKGSKQYSLTHQELKMRLDAVRQLAEISAHFPSSSEFSKLHDIVISYRQSAIDNLISCMRVSREIDQLTDKKFRLTSHLSYEDKYWFLDASKL